MMRKKLALIFVLLSSFQMPNAWAIVGVNSAGPGIIGTQHATFASGLDLGRTVGFVHYAGSTGTGTVVPSFEAGIFKFLTAAHNVDGNNDGVLDAGAGTIIVYFGNAPGGQWCVGHLFRHCHGVADRRESPLGHRPEGCRHS